jgi:murein DD-endopeptidase MepM/ murein hydrolase activator NlpD
MKSSLLVCIFLIVVFISNAQVQYIWPLKAMPSYSEVPEYYGINNFVDRNPAAGATLDWNCGNRTYDGHGGIDMDLWPFYWSMMDNNYVAVVAAAAGRVIAAVSNLTNESNCGLPGENTNWNYIAIRHADSSTSFYGHIRTNSAQVTAGQMVNAGDVIAFVGSSGSSSNPHLHFEVNSLAVTNTQAAGRIEPYVGLCNIIAPRWVTQKSYWEPAVVRAMTHGSRPLLAEYNSSTTCRTGEAKNAKAAFVPNDSIYFGIAIRDILENESFNISVFDPNGVQWFSQTIANNTGIDREKYYYVIDSRLPNPSTAGTYRMVVNFNGTTAVHFFSVNCPSSQDVPDVIIGWRGFKSSNLLTSTAKVDPGNRLLLQAATKITLLPGFVAKNGSILKARIKDCNYSE